MEQKTTTEEKKLILTRGRSVDAWHIASDIPPRTICGSKGSENWERTEYVLVTADICKRCMGRMDQNGKRFEFRVGNPEWPHLRNVVEMR